jgi:UDP-glucose 4-epimerase
MNCIVTGAAGFIGSHLVDRLLSFGYRVVGLDNMLLGRLGNLSQARQNPNFVFREMDVNDPARCIDFLKAESGGAEYQTLWHMAANSDIRAGGLNPEVDLTATFLTTFNSLKIMQALGIGQIAFASSSAIYGEHDGVLSEETGPLFPISNYGAMKLASEGIISAALERFAARGWIFRFPNVVGSRSTHGAIFDFLNKLKRNRDELEVLGDGTQEKPYLHVQELIDAMILIFQKAQDRLNYFNIATPDSSTTVRYIAEAVVRAAAPNAKIRYTGGTRGWIGDVPRFVYSIAKVQKLGWSPKLTSNQAIDRAISENLEAFT